MALVKSNDATLYPKFRTKSGHLTAYSFACGYLETYEGKSGGCNVEKDGTWHVKGETVTGGHYWECFDTVNEARKFARKASENGVPTEMIRGILPINLRKYAR